jgi:energy-coupling factor transporter ATP-binding protein EcfA2
MYVSVFVDIKKVTSPPARVHVSKVLERIRTGDNGLAELIESIRKGDGNREVLKKQLGAVVFAGYCGNGIPKVSRSTGAPYMSYRDDASLNEHAGLCVIDLDHLGEDLDRWIEHFKTDKHVYSAFISPSGDGLKIIYRIPADIDMHRAHYRAILDDLQQLGLKVDQTSINEARVCFVSYDPNIYINEDAEEYEKFMLASEDDDDAAVKEGDGLTDFVKLSIAAKMIDQARDGEKHRTLIKASYLMGGYIASKFVREEDARKMLRDRIKAKNPADLDAAYATIEDGLEQGKFKPIYEIEAIEKEFQIHLLREKYKSEDRGFTFLIDRNEVDRKMMDILVNGTEQGKPVGLDDIDRHFRFKENNFSVFLGHDNVGKSTLVWWLTAVAAAKHGWKWLIYSPENDIPKIKIKLMDYILGRPAKNASQGQLRMARKFVDEHFYFVRKDKVYNVYELLEFGRIMVDKDPMIKGFLIDPYNSLVLDYKDKGAGLSQYEYHMRAISELRVFAETHCSVYVSAHSVTEARRLRVDDSGDIPRPYKAHIDGGAIWANRCDDFYIIHRQVKNPERWMYTELHADKIKDTDTGTEVTRGDDEAVILQFWNNADFIDPDTKLSPLKEWRQQFFGEGVQKTMALGDLPLGDPNSAF